ncbi:MAG: diacylglycerol kinase family protein [Firmicutes bacterium]|nr:diacylglycerol kinase family protein [Bacillota bacterium]
MRTLGESFRNAFAGLRYVWLTERNMRIHLAMGLLALSLAYFGGVSITGLLFVVSATMVVVLSEAINTALEALVDLATHDFHPLAAKCKDVAAGAVLISAMYAIVVGLLVFLPEFDMVAANIAQAARTRPLALAAAVVCCAALGLQAAMKR